MNGFRNTIGIKNISERYFNAFSYKELGQQAKHSTNTPLSETQTTAFELLNKLSPAMPIAILRSNLDYKVTFISKSIENLLGYTSDEFYTLKLNQQLKEFTIDTIKNDNVDFLNRIKENTQNAAEGLEKKIQMRHKNGNLIWVKTWFNVSIDKSGNPTGFIGILHRINDTISNETELNSYLKFQSTLLSLARRFINIDKNDYSKAYQSLLEQVGETIMADRSYIFIHNNENEFTSNTYEWTNGTTTAEIHNLQEIPFQLYQPIIDKHKEGKPYICADVDLLKNSNPELYKHLVLQDIGTFIMIPLLKNNFPIGIIGFDRVKKATTISTFEIELLQIAAEIVMNAISNQDYELLLENEEIQKQRYINEIEQQKQKLENVINAVEAGTWEWDIQTGKTLFDEQWAKQLGYSLSELDDYSFDTWQKFVHPDDYPSVKLALDNYFSGLSTIFNTVYRLKHKNGNWVWINDIGQLLSRDQSGKPQTMFGIHLDVTNREQAKFELAQSEERFRFTFQNSLASMVIINPRTQQFEDVNDVALEFYGYTKEEFLKLYVKDLNSRSLTKI